MIKFMHTSDLLLGQKISNNNFSLRERQKKRIELFDSFKDMLEIAIKEKVQYLLIAGNLFNSTYITYSELMQVKMEFSKVKDIDVLISIGEADKENRNLINSIRWPANVHFQSSVEEISKFSFDDGAAVYLCGGNDDEKIKEKLYNIDTRENYISILISNCDVEIGSSAELKLNEKILKYKFDYCALGGCSKYVQVDSNMQYSGKFAQVDFENENISCGYILGEIDEKLDTKYVECGNNKYYNTEICVSSDESMINIIDKIRNCSEYKDYVRITIKGEIDSNISVKNIKNEAKQFFNYVEFVDAFKIKVKYEKKGNELVGNITENYINLFNKMDMNDDKNEKAFELGIELLKMEEVDD